jgi:hypothetical protein
MYTIIWKVKDMYCYKNMRYICIWQNSSGCSRIVGQVVVLFSLHNNSFEILDKNKWTIERTEIRTEIKKKTARLFVFASISRFATFED